MIMNKSKNHMSNIVYDFLVLKCVNIQTREGMVISFMDII